MIKYRKIWESHYGEIPKDELGRTYDIHHIDGNRLNNDISNLKAVSLQDHYNTHIQQGDIDAANLIAQRMGLEIYSGYNRPNHAKKMTGKNNPMYGKRGELCPNYGKKRPDQSAWMKENGIGRYKRTEEHKNNLRNRLSNKVICKDADGNKLSVDKNEFDNRQDLVGISSGIKQPKLNKKVECIEDSIIFESIKAAALYYGLSSGNIVSNIKSGNKLGGRKLGRCINFRYIVE
jgi:hypothetical protein